MWVGTKEDYYCQTFIYHFTTKISVRNEEEESKVLYGPLGVWLGNSAEMGNWPCI